MKIWMISAPLACLLLAPAWGAEAGREEPAARVARVVDQTPFSLSLENLSPATALDIWLYEQQWRRYDDPKQAVRRNAEFDAMQRRYRLAAQRWFGYCQSRPPANPVPFMGVFSPVWASSHQDPYRWVGGGHPTIVVQTAPRAAAAASDEQ